jgi:hypothetical protein
VVGLDVRHVSVAAIRCVKRACVPHIVITLCDCIVKHFRSFDAKLAPKSSNGDEVIGDGGVGVAAADDRKKAN